MQILEIKKEIGILLEGFDYHYNKSKFEEINKTVKDKLDRVDRSLLWMWDYGCDRALDLFILSKVKQVNTIIKSDNELSSYKSRGLDEEDLFQTGIIGVIHAAKKFDFRPNIMVRTFVANNIKFSIKNAYRQYGNIYVSREAGSIYSKCSKELDLLDDKIDTKKLKDISDKNDIDYEKIADSILAIKNRSNILPINTDGEIEAESDFLEKYKYKLVEKYEQRRDMFFDYKFAIDQMDKLSDKEKYVVEGIYIKDRTQKSISKDLKCSVTAVGKIKKKALAKIRAELTYNKN